MKKFLCAMMTLFITVASVQINTAQAANTNSSWLNTSKLNQGIVGVSYNMPTDKTIKLMITKGTSSYTYNLYPSDGSEDFSLQQGNGTYKISLFENTTGKSYKTLFTEEVDLSINNMNAVYLSSVQNVKWSSSDKAIIKAKQLIQGKTTDEEKVKAIYNYIVASVRYDYSLASNVSSDYIPNINNTLSSNKGICYDYSSLFAAMLRSVNVPTKLVMGNSSYVKEYHAWNEVLLNGKWVTIDTTVDAGLVKSKGQANWIKTASKYTAVKYY